MAAIGNTRRYEFKRIRAVRELFHGRFSDNEVQLLLSINNGNPQATVTYILEHNPRDVRQEVENHRRAQEAIDRVKPNCSQSLLDSAATQRINTEGDLFACAHCDKYWWRLTPKRKAVSKCFSCGRRYDVVPYDKWWGWAEFHCDNCQTKFNGWCHMQVSSPCYHCNVLVLPARILPPRKSRKPRSRNQSNNQHSCSECLAYTRGMQVVGRHGQALAAHRQHGNKCRCAHPPTRRALGLPAVIDRSEYHDSSGSTVDTFLPQGDLLRQETDFDDLETVAEVSDASDD